jgi:hypothetical protein
VETSCSDMVRKDEMSWIGGRSKRDAKMMGCESEMNL